MEDFFAGIESRLRDVNVALFSWRDLNAPHNLTKSYLTEAILTRFWMWNVSVYHSRLGEHKNDAFRDDDDDVRLLFERRSY